MVLNHLKEISLNIFEKMFENKMSMEERFISERFDRYIKLQDYYFCLELIDNGFQPNKRQNRNLYQKLETEIKNGGIEYKKIKDYKKLTFKYKALAFINVLDQNIFNSEELISNKSTEEIEDWNKLVRESIRRFKGLYIRNLSGSNYFSLDDNVEGKKQRNEFYAILKLQNSLIINNKLSHDQMLEYKTNLENCVNFIEKHLPTRERNRDESLDNVNFNGLERSLKLVKENLLGNEYKEEKEEILNKLKMFNINNRIEVVNNYSIKDLPINSQEKIHEIVEILDRLKNNDDNIFCQEKIQTIIKKFLSIDVEYRKTLMNVQGLNAEQLMESSLDNLKSLITDKLETKNQDKISELSVENRKVKSMC